MNWNKDKMKLSGFFHLIPPSELSGLEEFTEYLEAILNEPCSVMEDNGTLILIEIRQLVANVIGLKIEIYSKEHPPPHFHVKSATVNASFKIEDCFLLDGKISSSDYDKVRFWHQFSKQTLIDCWNETRPFNCVVGAYRGR